MANADLRQIACLEWERSKMVRRDQCGCTDCLPSAWSSLCAKGFKAYLLISTEKW